MLEWQGVITCERDHPLGTLAAVAARLTAMFPGLSFSWSPTGTEMLASAAARGVQLPEMVRRVMAAKPSNYSGSIESKGLSASFNLGASDPVTCIWATIGGEPELVQAALTRLQTQGGRLLTSPEPLAVQPTEPNRSLHPTGGATLVFEEPRDPHAPPAGEV